MLFLNIFSTDIDLILTINITDNQEHSHDHHEIHIYMQSCFQKHLCMPFSLGEHQLVPSSVPILNLREAHFHDQICTRPLHRDAVSSAIQLGQDLSLA